MDDGKMDGAEEPKVEGEMPVEPAVEGEEVKSEMPAVEGEDKEEDEEKKPEEGEAPKSW